VHFHRHSWWLHNLFSVFDRSRCDAGARINRKRVNLRRQLGLVLACSLLGGSRRNAGAGFMKEVVVNEGRTSDRVETLTVKRDESGMRLDRWFRTHFPEVTYTYLQKLLRTGQVRVNS